jgi:molecular chaperone GrpE
MLKRSQADFINYRRRVEDERVQKAQEATRDLILKLLPVLDDFERALEAASAEEKDSGWGKGVQLIERNLRSVLAGAGVQPIQAQGAEFNPWEHEALAHQPTDDAEEGSVLQVVRTGYKQGDRVIRPSQVVVARRPG